MLSHLSCVIPLIKLTLLRPLEHTNNNLNLTFSVKSWLHQRDAIPESLNSDFLRMYPYPKIF